MICCYTLITVYISLWFGGENIPCTNRVGLYTSWALFANRYKQ